MTASILDTSKVIVGASGSGKTVTAKHEVHELLDQRRHVAIVDPTGVWWGMRSNAAGDGPGFDLPIFGGEHGDVPIRPTDGAAIQRGLVIGLQRGSAALAALVAQANNERPQLDQETLASFLTPPQQVPVGATNTESAPPPPEQAAPAEGASSEAGSGLGPAAGDAPDREYKALAGLAAAYPAGLTEAAWAARTGYARKGGAWIRRRKRYLDDGLIEQRDGRWFATEAGVDRAGADIPDMPPPGLELVKWWSDRLTTSAARRALQLLAAVHPKALTRDAIAVELGMAPKGGAFVRAISEIKAAELAVEAGRRIKVADILMGDS